MFSAVGCVLFSLSLLVSAQAHALSCPAGNLAQGKPVSATGIWGDARAAVDGRLANRFQSATAPHAVVGKHDAFLIIDLGAVYPITALFLQAETTKSYAVEGSLDAEQWKWGWKAEPFEGSGLRTRFGRAVSPDRARYLRIRRADEGGFFAVSEIGAFCQVPSPWPPKIVKSAAVEQRGLLNRERMLAIKAVVAALGALLLLWGILLAKRNKEAQYQRQRKASLLVLALFAGLCWWNLFHFHFGQTLQISELYHHYLGAKYFRELQYTRLYECTTIADLENGHEPEVLGRRIRNLRTNVVEGTSEIRTDPSRCKNAFTASRWESFKKDVEWFHSKMSPDYWSRIQRDHGYNATPSWSILGRVLSLTNATDTTIDLLAWIDPLIVVLIWIWVFRVFGWRAACIALLWWGTNYPARYWFIGGSLLRHDWIVLTILGIGLAKRDRMYAGGAAIAAAMMLRIYPAFILFGFALHCMFQMLRQKRIFLAPRHRQFALGAAVATSLLLVLPGFSFGSAGVWGAFIENSRKHLDTPSDNLMGWSTVLSYDHDTRGTLAADWSADEPFTKWREAKRQAFERRQPLRFLVLGAFLVLFGFATSRQPDWVVLTLSIGFIPLMTSASSYYYGILLGFGLLPKEHKWAGVILCALASASCLASWLWEWQDEIHTWISLGVVLVVFAILAESCFVGRNAPGPNSGDATGQESPSRESNKPKRRKGAGSTRQDTTRTKERRLDTCRGCSPGAGRANLRAGFA